MALICLEFQYSRERVCMYLLLFGSIIINVLFLYMCVCVSIWCLLLICIVVHVQRCMYVPFVCLCPVFHVPLCVCVCVPYACVVKITLCLMGVHVY